MQFLLKLFRALNSAQTPWQVTLAITLGMIAGLTPISGIQSILILFLVFLLNIHLGLFFVASAVFAGVGYLFDPWFEQIGYAILSSEGLKGIWTTWYNSGLMRMTHFNNTLVAGSTVVALALAVPLYFALGWAINHYRTALSALLEKAPKLGLFGILKSTEKRDPLLRWWGAAIFVVLGGLVAFIAIVLVDPLAKWSLEAGGSALLQRDLRVGGVNVSFSEGSVTIDRLEIASEQEGVDAVSFDRAAIDIDLNALLLNRTHIEHITISGMGFETPATMKKDPAPPAKEKNANAGSGGFGLPSFELPTPESLLAKADLKIVTAYNQAQEEIKAIIAKWGEVAKGDDLSTAKLDELKNELDALKQNSKSKDPAQLIALAKDVKAFQEKVNTYKTRLETVKTDFSKDRKRIEELYALMRKASAEDFNKLKSAYDLSSGGAMNIIGAIFEDQIKTYIAQARRYYTMAEPYLQSEPKPPVPPRGEGRWMKYPLTQPDPDLWIAKMVVDGILKGQTFSAQVNDITDQQKQLGRPLTFTMNSDGPKVSKLVISGEDNRLGEPVTNRIRFASAGLPLEPMKFETLELGKSMLAFNGEVSLEGMKALAGASSLAFSDTVIDLKGEGKMMNLAAGILKGINAFKTNVDLGGTLLQPTVSVATDLDGKIAKGLGESFSKEALVYKQQLKSKLDGQMGDKLSTLKGTAGNLVDIEGLLGDRSKALTDLSGSAGSLGKTTGGSKIQKMFGF
ncbi:TIGR03545 family protein/TIGR03546 family protein [Malonomonas rubra DSM 5091]|uniref:TIGR03545 family protein/TIGR03546 family protein n=1 Tax=Malonomonas rubra DSM 5091 TaxID=1122189 RepID=A0A1M6JD32_MALRU|nr:TIGR03545 family protein [Malonomonas rubra]SHJ44522.1 TIGR03545 family protein/TIGR03546 family protein [Malonomonas rubra DSM 5091]